MPPVVESQSVIYLTRHGEGEHNLDSSIIVGRAAHARLTPRGRQQARQLAERLAGGPPLHGIVCSSLPRTMETGEIVAERLGGVPLHGDDAFWDLSKGDWEGTMPRPLPPHIQQAIDADPLGFRYGTGETFQEVIGRVEPRFDHWVARFARRRMLFVLHADIILAILHQKVGFPTDRISHYWIHPCSLTEMRYAQRNGFALVRLNEHLAG